VHIQMIKVNGHSRKVQLSIRIFIAMLLIPLMYQVAYLQTPRAQSALTQNDVFNSIAPSGTDQGYKAPISFFNYLHQGAKIDVRDMKSKFPNLKVDDFIIINLPDLSKFREVYNMMGVVDPESEEPSLIIWLLGNPNSEEVSFFIDKNNDRDYLNDDGAMQVYREKDPIKTRIYPFGDKNRPVEMNVQLPKKEKSEVEKLVKVLKNYSKNKIDNNFVLGLHAGVGIATLGHNYTITDSGYPGWYDTKLNEKNIGLSAEKYFRNFVVGARFTFQHIYQYASYFNEQVAPFERTGLHIKTSNNRDNHSETRVKAGLNAGFRIHLGEYFEVIPTFSGGYIYYLNGEYISNKFVEPNVTFEHTKDKYYEVAINMEFTSKDENSFVFGMSYTNTDWAPVGFFESIEGRDISDSHQTYAFFVGYKFGL